MESEELQQQLIEQAREIAWLQDQLERQRAINRELRSAVADLARTFQESLAVAYEAGELGDLAKVREITRTNRANWQQYLQQIIAASQQPTKE